MAVKNFRSLQNEKGQSIMEVVLVLPLLFLFVGLLYKLVMVEQMAINNAQAARSQMFVLTSHSPEYPRLEFRQSAKMFGNGEDRMVLGVSDPSALTSSADPNTIDPVPQTQKIARNGTEVKGSSDRGEVKLRTEVRVRDTASICTQMNTIGKLPWNSENVRGLGAQRWPFKMGVCQYAGAGAGE